MTNYAIMPLTQEKKKKKKKKTEIGCVLNCCNLNSVECVMGNRVRISC